MPDIPDISSMSPDRWLSKMQTVREELLEEFDRIFGATDEPDAAADAFETLFSEYSVQAETGESRRLLDVDDDEDRVIFEHESGDETVEVVYSEEIWCVAESEPEEPPDELAVHHRELAIEILELIPWWAEGAFTRRTGRPQDFVD